MAKNKIITSQGNVQFINSKGRTISVHPWHVYAVYESDTVSFLFVGMKDYSGQAIFASQYDDLEVNGVSYDNMEDLKEAISVAFAHAGAQARAEIVDELPEDPYTNTIYLVKKEHGDGYDEYIWNEEKEEWELIGDTDIEFERYLQITDFNAYSAATKTYIDSVSASTVANHNDIVSLSGAIGTEISARTAADEALSGAVDNVSSALTEEAQRAISAETALGNRIDTVNGRVDAEQTARAQADTALSGAIDTVSGAVASEATARANADTALSGAIDTEVSARTAADEAISGAVDTLSSGLTDEASARANADSALSGAIDTVDGKIDAETSARESADTAINGAINNLSTDLGNEVSARTAADEALETKVEAVSGSLETMGDEAIVDAAYVSSATTIEFYNASGTVVASIDASDFIKDGMIEDVRIENGYLVIDFNTASGVEDIEIPLSDIFDPDNYYDKTAIDGIVSGLNDSIDAKFDASGITAYSTSAEVTAEIEAAVSGKADADSVYSKSEVYTKGEVDSAIAQIDLSDYYTSAQTDSKIAEATSGLQETLVAGENITINGNVISAEGGSSITIDPTLDSGSTNPVANSAVTTAILSNEAVTSAALNDLNTRKAELSAMTFELGLKQDVLSAGTGIDITDNVISSIATGEQSDWNETDQNSEAYIKNRPFYGTGGWVYIIYSNENNSVNIVSDMSEPTDLGFVLSVGKQYQIAYMYDYQEVTPQNIENIPMDRFMIGTPQINNTGSYTSYSYIMGYNSEEPWNTFAVSNDLENWYFVNYSNSNYGVYMVVYDLVNDPLVQLDSKYIKDDIARVSAVTASLATKQDVLSAGTNITISGNVISASGGGDGVQPSSSENKANKLKTINGIALSNSATTTGTTDIDVTHFSFYNPYSPSSFNWTSVVGASTNWLIRTVNGENVLSKHAPGVSPKDSPIDVHGDWNVSNSSSTNYIKNRPFYEESTEGNYEVVYQSSSVEQIENTVSFTTSSALKVGDKMRFSYSYDGGSWSIVYGNNESHIPVVEDFIIAENQGGGYIASDATGANYATSNDLTNWTFQMEMGIYSQVYFRVEAKMATVTVHKLDSKFIDSDIARSSRLGGLSLVKITQSAYDALVQAGTTDPNTLYIISD